MEKVQNQKMFVRRIVVKKGQQIEKAKLVYDYEGN